MKKEIKLLFCFIVLCSLISCKCEHEIVIDEAVVSTCTSTGLTEGSHCSKCNEIIVAQEIVDKKEHTIVIDPSKASTVLETGLTEGSHCSICNEIIVAQTVTPIVPSYHVTFTADSESGLIAGANDQLVEVGKAAINVKAIANVGKKFVSWSDGSTEINYSFTPTEDTELEALFADDNSYIPVLYINTNGNASSISKDSWTIATISTQSTNEDYCNTDLSAKIKGRGNSTWEMPKKPYKIKLDSKKNLFGLGKAKNWVLLANYDDPSSLRNQLAFNVGKQLDDIKDFTTDTIMVEVFLDNAYIGIYNLVEQIETGKNRVDILEDYTVADTGFIVELDGIAPSEGTENIDYFVCGGQYYAIKDPDPDDKLTSEEMAFIKQYFIDSYNALKSNDYNSIKALIDVDTFASTYIVQELFKSVDVGDLSVYFYKDAGEKLCSGPIWDFDITCGNCDYSTTSIRTDYLYAKEVNVWYSNLLRFDEFKLLVATKLDESKEDILSSINTEIEFALEHQDSYYRNFNTWKTIGVYVWPNTQTIVNIKTWEGNVDYLKNWLIDSLEYLINVYPTE